MQQNKNNIILQTSNFTFNIIKDNKITVSNFVQATEDDLKQAIQGSSVFQGGDETTAQSLEKLRQIFQVLQPTEKEFVVNVILQKIVSGNSSTVQTQDKQWVTESNQKVGFFRSAIHSVLNGASILPQTNPTDQYPVAQFNYKILSGSDFIIKTNNNQTDANVNLNFNDLAKGLDEALTKRIERMDINVVNNQNQSILFTLYDISSFDAYYNLNPKIQGKDISERDLFNIICNAGVNRFKFDTPDTYNFPLVFTPINVGSQDVPNFHLGLSENWESVKLPNSGTENIFLVVPKGNSPEQIMNVVKDTRFIFSVNGRTFCYQMPKNSVKMEIWALATYLEMITKTTTRGLVAFSDYVRIDLQNTNPNIELPKKNGFIQNFTKTVFANKKQVVNFTKDNILFQVIADFNLDTSKANKSTLSDFLDFAKRNELDLAIRANKDSVLGNYIKEAQISLNNYSSERISINLNAKKTGNICIPAGIFNKPTKEAIPLLMDFFKRGNPIAIVKEDRVVFVQLTPEQIATITTNLDAVNKDNIEAIKKMEGSFNHLNTLYKDIITTNNPEVDMGLFRVVSISQKQVPLKKDFKELGEPYKWTQHLTSGLAGTLVGGGGAYAVFTLLSFSLLASIAVGITGVLIASYLSELAFYKFQDYKNNKKANASDKGKENDINEENDKKSIIVKENGLTPDEIDLKESVSQFTQSDLHEESDQEIANYKSKVTNQAFTK
jgi:hypothetical protein